MSFISTQAKLNIQSKRLSHRGRASKPVDRSYSNFAGSNVPILTKEQYDKGMAIAHKMKTMSAW